MLHSVSNHPREAAAYGRGVAVFFGALFLIYGIHLPYFPVWLDWRGLSAENIALIVALPYLVRFFASPLVALWADRGGRHRQAAIALAWSALGAALLLTGFESFWSILPAALALSLAMTSVMPLIETLAVRGVRDHNLDYGRMRLWGSISFVVASLFGGQVIASAGAWTGIWLVVAACAITAVASHGLPRAARPTRVRASAGTAATVAPYSDVRLADGLELLRQPAFVSLLVATGTVQAAHATYYTFGTLHWLEQGISPLSAGGLWAVGVVAEIVLFARGRAVVARFGAVPLLLGASLIAMLRWTAMAMDPPFGVLVGLQILHAATFGAAHLAAIHLVHAMVPEELQGTGQALHASVGMGLAMGGAVVVSGWLYGAYGGGAYFGMAALAAVAACAAALMWRLWDGGTVIKASRMAAASPSAP